MEVDDNQKIYDEMVEKSSSGHQYIYSKETLRMLDEIVPKNVKILDVGCGTGHVAEVLKDREWYGVDISPLSIEKARQYYKEVKVGDITRNIPFPDNSFDVVFALGIFHHIPDKMMEALKEIRRVLKKNGILIIIDHNNKNLEIKKAHEGILKIVPCKNERTISKEYLMNLLIEERFQSTEAIKYITIRGDQQSLTPPIWKKIYKCPFLFLLGLISSQSTDFMIKATKNE